MEGGPEARGKVGRDADRPGGVFSEPQLRGSEKGTPGAWGRSRRGARERRLRQPVERAPAVGRRGACFAAEI
eukprot:3445268-Rhodomonas_salina.1